jgi:hypothetical protein
LRCSLPFSGCSSVSPDSGASPLFRRGWWTDAAWWVFTPLVVKAVSRVLVLLPFVILIGLGVASAEGAAGARIRGVRASRRQPIWLQFIEVHVLADLIAYWTHRKFHGGRWWPFHAVHHSSEDLDWLSSVRVHPVNSLAVNLIQSMPLVLLGFNPFVTLSAAPVFTFYAIPAARARELDVRTAGPRDCVTRVPPVASLEGAGGRRSELCRPVLFLGCAVRDVLLAEGSRAAEFRESPSRCRAGSWGSCGSLSAGYRVLRRDAQEVRGLRAAPLR